MASPVALEELLVSSLAQTDRLAKLLIEKSVINYAQSNAAVRRGSAQKRPKRGLLGHGSSPSLASRIISVSKSNTLGSLSTRLTCARS